jgi:signal transduction histidine kinase/DNA-binding response OmpR family regulator
LSWSFLQNQRNMRNKKFMLYLLGIFVTTIMLIVFLQYNSNNNINKLIQGNESLIREFRIIGETQKLETHLLFIESHIYRTVFSKDSSFYEDIKTNEGKVREILSNLRPLVVTDSTKDLVHDLDSLTEVKLKLGHIILDTLYMKGQSAAIETYKSRRKTYVMGDIVHVIDLLNKPRQQYLTRLAIDANQSGKRAREWGLILAITAVLASIFTFIFITKRIRRQQQLYEQLNESEKRVREAGIIKENFMANMSHEIRTPMNAILGFTNLLEKEPLNKKSGEFVHSIQKSGENLLEIINDILDFSKIEAGMLRIESNPFSMRELLDSVKTMFTTKIQAKDLSFAIHVENSIPDLLTGDAVRLTQILVNLVNNAIKFTNSGGIEINVSADKKMEDAIGISISVKDTGIGIPSNKMDVIFERFQQADEDTTRKYGGTGLGLSIVKHLVELQNGTIHVISEPNKGTEFVFSIPYLITKEFSVHDEVKSASLSEIKAIDNRLKILIAEDNVMNQDLMRHLLSYWHFDFDIVNNGKEAIEALQQHDYQLLLMDIQMPLMDGYTTTTKIRNELKINIPIIAMTAHAMAGEREKCLGYGMNEYISKPIREKELYNIMNKFPITNGGKTGIKNESTDMPLRDGLLLDLDYLNEVSGGNTEFEIRMIKQFLQQVPAELEAMKEAFDKTHNTELAHIAHNLKTSVSFMGLSNKLDHYLNYIESNAAIQNLHDDIKEKIMTVMNTCQKAFREAKDYLAVNTPESNNRSEKAT